MAESVVSFLFNRLSSLLDQKCTQLAGIRREVESLKDELGSMGVFLRDAEAKQDANELSHEDQEWVKQVRDVAYDTEDVVEEIFTFLANLIPLCQIQSEIREINDRIKRISERHQRYPIPQGGSRGHGQREIPQNPIRNHDLLIEETKLVGIELPKRQLIEHILDGTSHLKVASVVGMGGLGKSTLVRKVYDASEVTSVFSPHRAWLTISQTYQIKDVFHKLMKKLGMDDLDESWDDNELREKVKAFLEGKKYIIVLDDVWSINAWESIKYAFPDNANCYGRVILTTRKRDVATECCRDSRGYLHEMKPLSHEESLALFCRKIFGEDSCPPDLKDISCRILSKCDGLPLGIVAIAGLLAARGSSREDEWEKVHRSLGGELDRVTRILLLSYNDLPYNLKSCLLCMGMYPEDEIVWKRELIRLWIGQGFVEERQGMSLEEVAEIYANELINRSLIQLDRTDQLGSPSGVHVHDLLYEIIVSKCRDYNILSVRSTSCLILPATATIRCLKLYVDRGNTLEPFRLPHLRYLVIEADEDSLSELSLSKFLKGVSKSLKMLDIKGLKSENIPDEIFKFYHLTYLSLYADGVKRIPEAIGKLRNLEVLDMRGARVKELPVEILKLKKLRHLYLYVSRFTKAPDDIGVLSSLEILSDVEADNEKCLREVGKLTQLRELNIRIKGENGRELCSSLVKLTHLCILRIDSQGSALDLEYPISSSLQFLQFLQLFSLNGKLVKVPDWISSLRGLTKLFLRGSNLREDPLESIADIPNLAFLKLEHDAYAGDSLHFKAGKFQKLKMLQLVWLDGLRKVILENGTMSNMMTFCLWGCESVEELPHGLQYLTKLQEVHMAYMADKLRTHLVNLDPKSDDHKNINHIPKFYVDHRLLNTCNRYVVNC